MAGGNWQKKPVIINYLLKTDIYDQLEKVLDKHELPHQRLGEFLDLTDAIINELITVDHMPEMIEQAFGLDKAKATSIAADIAGYRLLPLRDYIEGVEQYIVKWGGNIGDYPYYRIDRTEDALDIAIRDFAKAEGLDLPERLTKRFVYIAKGYLEKKRAKEATITLMERPLMVGGLGLDEAQSQKLIKELEEKIDLSAIEKIKATRFDPAKVSAQEQEPQKPKKPAPKVRKEEQKTSSSTAARTPKQQKLNAPAQPQEKKKIKKPSEPAPKSKPAKQAKTSVVKRRAGAIRPLPPLPPEPKPKKVIKKATRVIAPKIKQEKQKPAPSPVAGPAKKQPPLRSTAIVPHTETALSTTTPVIAGNLLHDHEHEELKAHASAAKKTKNDQYTKVIDVCTDRALSGVRTTLRKYKIPIPAAKDLLASHIRGRRSERQLRALFESRYKVAQDQVLELTSAAKQARQAVEAAYKKIPKKTQKTSTTAQKERVVINARHAKLTGAASKEKINSIHPIGRVSAARSHEEELELHHNKLEPEFIVHAKTPEKPKKAKARLSNQSAPPQKKGRIADVVATPKLMGPTEEVGTMTPKQFRRLSSDPMEAIQKIEDKLDLIEEQGYEDRVKAVLAWRKSPINRLYVRMTKAALVQGRSVSEVASSRRAKGEESLSPAEVRAIVELNKRIQLA